MRFGASGRLQMALGAVGGATTQARSIAALVNLSTTGVWQNIMSLLAGGSTQLDLTVNSTNQIMMEGTGSSTGFTVTAGPQMLGSNKAGGSAVATFHRYDYATGAFTHSAGSGSVAQGSAASNIAIGSFNTSADLFPGDQYLLGVWNRELTTAEWELLPFSLAAWDELKPDALWLMDGFGGALLLVDRTGGGANETSRTGTLADSPTNLPIFSYGAPVERVARPAVAGPGNYNVTAADSAGGTDAAAGLHSGVRAAADSAGVSDGASATVKRFGVAADTAGGTDAAAGSKTKTGSASDSAPATDAVGRQVAVSRGAADAAGVSEVAVGRHATTRTANTTLTTSDAAAGVVTQPSLYSVLVDDFESYFVGDGNPPGFPWSSLYNGDSISSEWYMGTFFGPDFSTQNLRWDGFGTWGSAALWPSAGWVTTQPDQGWEFAVVEGNGDEWYAYLRLRGSNQGDATAFIFGWDGANWRSLYVNGGVFSSTVDSTGSFSSVTQNDVVRIEARGNQYKLLVDYGSSGTFTTILTSTGPSGINGDGSFAIETSGTMAIDDLRYAALSSAGSFTKGASDSAPATDTAKGIHAQTKLAADSAPATTTAQGVHATARGAADSAGATDSASATVTKVGLASDGAPGTDTAGALHAGVRAAADSAGGSSQTATATHAQTKTASDSAGGTDTAAGSNARQLTGTAGDSAGASDAAVGRHSVTRQVGDGAGAADAASCVGARARGVADSAPGADAGVGVHATARGAADSTVTSDTGKGLHAGLRGAADAAPAADVLGRQVNIKRGAVDGAGVSDTSQASTANLLVGAAVDVTAVSMAVTRTIAVTRGAADSAPAVDQAGGKHAGVRGAVDVAGVVDVAAAIGLHLVGAVDAAPASDVAAMARQRAVFAFDTLPTPLELAELAIGLRAFGFETLPLVVDAAVAAQWREVPPLEGKLSAVLVVELETSAAGRTTATLVVEAVESAAGLSATLVQSP